MLRSGCWLALWWLLVSVEAVEQGAAVDDDNTTALFRAAETDVLRFRRSRDENGKGDESYLRDALVKYTSLQQHPDYATSLNEETHVLVLDSCEFCHRTLGEYDAALRYAKQLADSRLCQLDADGCFASGAYTPAVSASLCLPLRSYALLCPARVAQTIVTPASITQPWPSRPRQLFPVSSCGCARSDARMTLRTISIRQWLSRPLEQTPMVVQHCCTGLRNGRYQHGSCLG